MEDNRMIYLTTQTWSYKAIGLYKSFGFKPYYDYDQAFRGSQAGDAEAYYQNAWALIDEKSGNTRTARDGKIPADKIIA